MYSNQHEAVEDAWHAVGIGPAYSGDIYVPDDNFENYLEANGMGDGIYGNDSFLTQNVVGVTFLNVAGLSIVDLTGIEGFISLEYLYVNNNLLSSLDISNNIDLIGLSCQNNQLNTLDISNNPDILVLLILFFKF